MKVTILSNLIMEVAFLHVHLTIFIRSKWAEVQSMLKWKGLHRVWILRDRDVGASLATGYHTITLKHTLKDIHVFPRELVSRVKDGRQELTHSPPFPHAQFLTSKSSQAELKEVQEICPQASLFTEEHNESSSMLTGSSDRVQMLMLYWRPS